MSATTRRSTRPPRTVIVTTEGRRREPREFSRRLRVRLHPARAAARLPVLRAWARRRRASQPAGPLRRHAGLLPPRNGRRNIVFLADNQVPDHLLQRYLAGLPGEQVAMLAAAGSTAPPSDRRISETVIAKSHQDEIEWFAQQRPIDIIVDLRDPKREPRRARWLRLFLFLSARGVYVVPRRDPQGDLRSTEREWLAALVDGVARGTRFVPGDVEAECARSVAGLTVRADVIVIEKRLTHLVKLSDDESTSTLVRRNPEIRVRVVQRLAAGNFQSPATVVSHAAAWPLRGLETSIELPELSVRHYSGVLAYGGKTLLYTNNSVLSDSSRFFLRSGLANPRLHSVTNRIARVRHDAVPAECLVGDFYQVDPQYSGHFGHVMTELVARLWGWDRAKEQLPDLKAFFMRRPGTDALLERTLLNAYAISDDDIVIVDRPAYVRSLVSANMLWHNGRPNLVHPEILKVWQRIRPNVIDPAAPTADRIFVSRTDRWSRRRCENLPEVEHFFADRGFVIYYPEHHAIPEQAAMFAGARVIAGVSGSAMFNLMYAERVETVILLTHEFYSARNEHLYCLVLGCVLHYFWSTPNVSPDARGTLEAYDADWEFDFERNRAALTDLLNSV